LAAADILVDLSKNIMTDETRTLLEQLAVEAKLTDQITAMFTGQVRRPLLAVSMRWLTRTVRSFASAEDQLCRESRRAAHCAAQQVGSA
jgi:glucose-6-phosphate isomerase